MQIVEIDGYLTQDKLEKVCKKIADKWHGEEARIEKTRKRWDMVFDLNGIKYAVEFDGDRHYREPKVIESDRWKDKYASDNGITVVRIPYWVQLTTETIKFYLNIDVKIHQNYPHGFIDKKAMLPSSFCELGIFRFISETLSLPENVRKSIIDSLILHMNNKDVEYVVPKLILQSFPLLSI